MSRVLHRLATLILAFLLVSCAGIAAPDILTTTTILADVTKNIVGDRFSVSSLLPFGADPHSYQPTPQDTARISDSKLLVINGAEYEHFMEPLIENADGQRPVIEASGALYLRKSGQDDTGSDPHLWLDPNNMIVYVQNIRNGLEQFDPEGVEAYAANAEAYITQLRELDAWIKGQVTQIEPGRRLLITNHAALGYFAERYGFHVVGTVIESFSSEASPSAEQMAGVVEQIKLLKAPAIFLDVSDNPALAQQIASETGVKVISDLHFESLTDGAPASTYIEMMRYNVTKITEALK